MLEILAPAGSAEGVVAAVQNGADAVYLGFGDFNARRNARNFTAEEFKKAAEYCRIRGVKTYVTLNTLASDRELPEIAKQAVIASEYGADAILVQDLGVLRAVKQAAPDVPVHASTQMSIHNLSGVMEAARLGAERVVLARELSKKELAFICKHSPVEIEVFVHGALCMCYSGQCYMSSVIGRRSGNRGLCAQPCRLPYQTGRQGLTHPLSLKDNCLVKHLHELEDMGVKCIKIEGRMKRPEYAAIVTGIYSKAVREGRTPAPEEMRALTEAFSRQGFTDGYYTDEKGRDMFGVRTEDDKSSGVIFATARKNYLNGEFQRVPVRFIGAVRKDETAKLLCMDDRGNTAAAEGAVPEPAFHRELTATVFQTQMHKTGGTPFYCDGVKSTVDPGLSLSMAYLNDMRRDVLNQILEKRKALPERRKGEFRPCARFENKADASPVLTVSVKKAEQLSDELAALSPAVLYVPMQEIVSSPKALIPFMKNEGTQVCVIMPRIMHDPELKKVGSVLTSIKKAGIDTALCGNIGQFDLLRSLGFSIRGDYGLNVFNSETADEFKNRGLISLCASFELRLEQIRDLSKPVDTEMIAYGRLPLMVTENCVSMSSTGACSCDSVKNLRDRTGAAFPVFREYECRTEILNSKKVFLADRWADIARSGVWAARLTFSTENAKECIRVMKSYMGLDDYVPSAYTRGLYARGVE